MAQASSKTTDKGFLYNLYKNTFYRLLVFISDRVEFHGAQYLMFTFFSLFSYLIPYLTWTDQVMGSFSLFSVLRMNGCLMCFMFFLEGYIPKHLERYFSLYWCFVVGYCLSYSSIFLILENSFCAFWTVNFVLCTFMMLFLLDWVLFMTVMIVSSVIAIGHYIVLHHYDLPAIMLTNEYKVTGYMYIFFLISAVLFARKKDAVDYEKIEALTALSGIIAHELRTPLATIAANSKSLERYFPMLIDAYEKAAEHGLIPDDQKINPLSFQAIGGVLGRQKHVVNKAFLVLEMLLVQLKKVQVEENLEELSIKECVEEALRDYPMREDEREFVSLDIALDFKFKANRVIFIHVIYNLIKNALFHIKSSGGKIDIWTNEDSRWYHLYVRDNGDGMSTQQLGGIFQPFYSKRKSGFGLGLFFCRRVMEDLGGNISCDSTKNKYTQFRLSFPKS